MISGRRRLDGPAVDDAAGPSIEEEVAFVEGLARSLDRLGGVINLQCTRAADADFAHLPGYERGVQLTPPLAVRMPSAAIMPRKSSGEVSYATSSTFSPRSAAATARSALR